MRVPLSWLKEYVDVDASPAELASRLTFSGLEVEAIETTDGDTVIELEVTPNRPDCLSIIGVAREVAALFGRKLRLPPVEFAEDPTAVDTLTRVDIKDPKACPRYTARVLADVRVAPSPDWMARRLAQCGVKPINNIVDVTNYVLLECGHPLHAFDQTLLHEERIVVRPARAGEKMTTLDGVSRDLSASMLVIADADRPVAVAGIMGGSDSEIKPDTRRVLLESACFNPVSIRRTAKKLGLSTEASMRFERGADVGICDWASRRAVALALQLAGGRVMKGVVDAYPRKPTARKIRCRYDAVRTLIGIDIPVRRITDIFEALDLAVTRRSRKGCVVVPPSFRVDLEAEVDLIEEVARIHGLDKIPDDRPKAKVIPGADDRPQRASLACRANLVSLGLTEIMNYSYVAEDLLAQLGTVPPEQWIKVMNPNSATNGPMRPSLLPQMVESLGRNAARQVDHAALFEIGRIFFKEGASDYREETRVSVGLMGKAGRSETDRRRAVKADEVFFWLKGVIQGLFTAQHLGDLGLTPVSHPFFEEGKVFAVKAGEQVVGVMGLVAPAVRAKWRLAEPVGVAEFQMAALTEHIFSLIPLKPVPLFPSVSRDMAVVVDESVTHEEIVRTVRRNAPPELTGVTLFDIFRSEQIGAGRKSLAYSLVYCSGDRTLTDEEANGYHQNIKQSLKKSLNIEIREG